MTIQSEQVLENSLIDQLVALGYEKVEIKDELDIVANLKSQLEKHNQTQFSDKEFKQVLNHLARGNVFKRAKILRDRMKLARDNGDVSYIEFLDKDKWCKNLFQVTQQVSMKGRYRNRYDVTLLINGLPLVQIELKRRGLELKEAFNQTGRYQRHSYNAGYGLFQYIQFFVISNGINTKYYANRRGQSFKQTFYWSDVKNRRITNLEEFTQEFLEPCHMSKMVCQYTVLHETNKALMVMRPYQYYAAEAIIERVKTSNKHGYIWHTTGSGKTLTSFKASQVLSSLPEVRKVIFVVDRKDLDHQTINEFNAFRKGSVDGTDNTKVLVDQLADDSVRLIVTTIQKLNNAVTHGRYQQTMAELQDKKVVLIFDECHRSQFGKTHAKIREHFTNAQMFGFTGTPIFAKNAVGRQTTKDLFDEQLHSYVITNAIKDENVLRFSAEYIGRYQRVSSQNEIDIEVEAIDTKEVMESEKRIIKIVDYIIANHDRKTHNRDFTAILCVSSIEMLIQYYEIFRQKRLEDKHNLRLATIYSYAANEESKEAEGMLDDDALSILENSKINSHSRERLDEFIEEYNQTFNTSFSTKDSQLYYGYYKDIAKRVKNAEIDILLVVNMFLTGFDSKTLNTLYVDKNLRFHGLIQAYSRTNRILNDKKSQGNIVVFRNLKKNTDEALALYSDKNAAETIFLAPYEEYVEKFGKLAQALHIVAPTVDSVSHLQSEEEELKFVQAFRELMRTLNILASFADFKFTDLTMTKQSFEDYKSKYLDIYDKVRTDTQKEQVSILDDIDFETELIHRDDINVNYVLRLIARMRRAHSKEEAKKRCEKILSLVASEVEMRSKYELIKKFIEGNLPQIDDLDDIPQAFARYWNEEKQQAFNQLCQDEGIEPEKLTQIIGQYLFTEREPLNEDIANMLKDRPEVLKYQEIVSRIKEKIMTFISTFAAGEPDITN